VSETKQVLVVGGGPVGLLTTLGLARQGIPVTLIEQEPALTIDLRAGSFHPPTLEMMAPYGITDRMHERGIKVPLWQIRDRRERDLIANFDLTLIADLTPYPYRLHLEQHRLTPIILDFLEREPNATVRFGTRFVDARQSGDGVVATIESGGQQETIEASYLVGCDGGRSAVRKLLGVEFEGFTWPERYFVISTTHDLAQYGWAKNAYCADPDEWVALFKMPGDPGSDGLWRVVVPVDNETPDEVLTTPEALEARLQAFQPKSGTYPIAYHSFYRVHQRVMKEFRKGRVIVAGDAAHINNPLGAFGLNSGIHDASNLIPKLGAVWHGKASPELLDVYARQRRTATVEFVQAMSIRNKRTLEERDPQVRRGRMEDLIRTASTPALAREFLINSSMISSVRRAQAVA
jgi:3-(3-hydroxy-phenyl)propionate hydroxylase